MLTETGKTDEGNRAETGRIPCLKCLLRDLPGEEALRAVLAELIGRIPAEERTDPEILETRLAACRRCPHLHGGTCEMCGCYVEHRAERKGASCPETPARW